MDLFEFKIGSNTYPFCLAMENYTDRLSTFYYIGWDVSGMKMRSDILAWQGFYCEHSCVHNLMFVCCYYCGKVVDRTYVYSNDVLGLTSIHKEDCMCDFVISLHSNLGVGYT